MAEYWKSTPKYWCKFCSVYVRDTKFERAQHEATGRHQGAIQRSLKGLHKEQQAEERRKQQAKNEVARLNGLVSGSGSSSSTNVSVAAGNASGDSRVGAKPTFSNRGEKQATLEDRKRQLNQLAAMGISGAVPEEIRREMAMAGDWQTVSERVVGEDGVEKKSLSTGVHKRKLDEEEEEAVAAGEIITKKKGWGNTFRSFPGKMGGGEDDDLETLFNKAKKPTVKVESEVKEESKVKDEPEVKEEGEKSVLKDIPTEEEAAAQANTKDLGISVKKEDDAPAPAVVFKKRKKIAK